MVHDLVHTEHVDGIATGLMQTTDRVGKAQGHCGTDTYGRPSVAPCQYPRPIYLHTSHRPTKKTGGPGVGQVGIFAKSGLVRHILKVPGRPLRCALVHDNEVEVPNLPLQPNSQYARFHASVVI